jgi:hypothetical protein
MTEVMVRDVDVLVTDGLYLETKEHIGGFWILETANLEEALAWVRNAVAACQGARDFFRPRPEATGNG